MPASTSMAVKPSTTDITLRQILHGWAAVRRIGDLFNFMARRVIGEFLIQTAAERGFQKAERPP